jgi:hypothetical protein
MVILGGVHFGDAMVVRQQMTAAAQQAARACAVQENGHEACAIPQAEIVLGNAVNRCDPTDLQAIVLPFGGVEVLRVDISCRYIGGFSRVMQRFGGGAIELRAQATQPLR